MKNSFYFAFDTSLEYNIDCDIIWKQCLEHMTHFKHDMSQHINFQSCTIFHVIHLTVVKIFNQTLNESLKYWNICTSRIVDCGTEVIFRFIGDYPVFFLEDLCPSAGSNIIKLVMVEWMEWFSFQFSDYRPVGRVSPQNLGWKMYVILGSTF